MAVILDIRSMQADFKAFGKAAKNFIENPQRLLSLETQLANAAASSKRGDQRLEWSTDLGDGGPICTMLSSDYRNRGAGEM